MKVAVFSDATFGQNAGYFGQLFPVFSNYNIIKIITNFSGFQTVPKLFHSSLHSIMAVKWLSWFPAIIECKLEWNNFEIVGTLSF